MASDASIYSLIRPAAPAIDPVEQYGKGLSLANMIGQQEVQGLQTQKLRSDLQGEAEFKKLFTGGRTPTETEAIAADPTRGMAYGKAQIDRRKSEAEALKVDLENARNRLAAVQTDVDLAALREDVMRKQGPTAAADIPPSVSDPRFAQWKQTHMMSADKAIDWLKPHLQIAGLGGKSALVETNPNATGFKPDVDLTHTATIGETETMRHNPVMERNAAAQLAETKAEHGRVADREAAKGKQDKLQIVTDTQGNITVVDKNTGVGKPAVDQKGEVLKGRQNMTESQGKAAGMLHRATTANDILNTLEDAGHTNRGVIKQAAGAVPLIGGGLEMGVNTLPAIMGGPSSSQQKVEQARRDFVNAALRVESGAAISESEFRNAERQYFPMPGDTKEVLAQKRQNRQTELEALKLQAGPGGPVPSTKAPDKSVPDAVPTQSQIDAELRRRGVIK